MSCWRRLGSVGQLEEPQPSGGHLSRPERGCCGMIVGAHYLSMAVEVVQQGRQAVAGRAKLRMTKCEWRISTSPRPSPPRAERVPEWRIATGKCPPHPGPLSTLPRTPHPACGHLLPIRCGEGVRGGVGIAKPDDRLLSSEQGFEFSPQADVGEGRALAGGYCKLMVHC
jgi:hypothetical protein